VLRGRALRAYAESTWISGDVEKGSDLLQGCFDIFRELEDEGAIAVLLHRQGVAALMSDDVPRAGQLLEESLELCRRRPNPKLEADAIGKLGWVERRAGNREGALVLFERSAVLCEEVGFTWMQANATLDVADLSHELGRRAVARERGEEALRLSRDLHDRQFIVYGLALLARFAAAAGEVMRAGCLWGSIEAEESRAPVGQWEHEREEYAAAIVVDGDPEFEAARADGRRLSLDEAVEFALTGRNEPAPSSSEVNA
jgi:tetratricopeptide (TPR) repeat protein